MATAAADVAYIILRGGVCGIDGGAFLEHSLMKLSQTGRIHGPYGQGEEEGAGIEGEDGAWQVPCW